MPKAKPSQQPAKRAAPKKQAKRAFRGRPPGESGYRPTEQERAMVERMAAIGIPIEDMILLLPSPNKGKLKPIHHISVNTLSKHYAHEIATGRVKAKMAVANAFFRSCTGTTDAAGNVIVPASVAAQIWYTKTQMGWKETLRLAPGRDGDEERVIEEENSVLEDARRVAFTMALGARLAIENTAEQE